MERRPLNDIEHRVYDVPVSFFQDLLLEVDTLDPHQNCSLSRIVVYFQFSTFPPHMIQHTLYLAVGRRSSIETTDNEVHMKICTFLEHNIRDEN